ncbi:MAG: hypothetical protein PVH25_15000 [Burkholderiales bacterium]|jgi:hypothetical protein
MSKQLNQRRFSGCGITVLVALCLFAFQAGAQADDDVLSPDAVTPDPALSPEEMSEPPVRSPDAVAPDPALSPEEMSEPPVRSPDAVAPDPALSPEEMTEPPIPEG